MAIPSAADADGVLLLRSAPDPAFDACLLAGLPGLSLLPPPAGFSSWLRRLFEPGLAGVVADADDLGLGELRALQAALERESGPWLLVLTGDRGLAGCETLLDSERVAVLPKPWTPNGLASCLQRLRRPVPASPAAGASDAFLVGLVEGLRDPLSSLGGYLQLMEHHADAGSAELLRPAMEAARSLERQIESLYLAAGPARGRADRSDLRALAAEALKEARREDARVEADLPEGELAAATDPRFVRAALAVARMLLERFGPGGAVRLCARNGGGALSLVWESAAAAGDAPAAAGSKPPPAFLPQLLERLAARAPAEAVLEQRGAVPVRAGLRWPAAARR